MATLVGIGSSKQSDAFQAGQEAAQAALDKMGGTHPTLVFLFGSVRFDQENLLQGVLSITKSAPLIGCSSAGEILPEGRSLRSVVVMTIQSDNLQVATGLGKGLYHNAREAGQEAAKMAVKSGLVNPHGFMIFPDGLMGNAAEAIRGIQEVLGLSFPIVGGSAADDFIFSKTYQYHLDELCSNAITGVLFAGNIKMGIGARHGWQPLGKPRMVTKASGNVVQELDGHSAVNLYETYFGQAASQRQSDSLADMSVVYPLGMPIPGEEEYLLRNVLKVDANGALVYAGEVPEETEVRLMMGSKAKALDAAKKAAQLALSALSGSKPSFALVFSSCSRARLFGRHAGEEIAIIKDVLGDDVPLIGFYDYGEQAPLTATGFRGRSYFHNETVVVSVIAA